MRNRVMGLLIAGLLISVSAWAQEFIFNVAAINGVDDKNVKVDSSIKFQVDEAGQVKGILTLKNLGKKALLTNSASDQVFLVDKEDTNFSFSLKNPQADPGSINPFDQMEATFLDRQDDFARNLGGVLKKGEVKKLALVLDSINLIFYYEPAKASS